MSSNEAEESPPFKPFQMLSREAWDAERHLQRSGDPAQASPQVPSGSAAFPLQTPTTSQLQRIETTLRTTAAQRWKLANPNGDFLHSQPFSFVYCVCFVLLHQAGIVPIAAHSRHQDHVIICAKKTVVSKVFFTIAK